MKATLIVICILLLLFLGGWAVASTPEPAHPGTHQFGKSFGQLEITERYGCFVSGITRASIDLPYDDNMLVNKGDRLHVTGEEDRIHLLAGNLIGYLRSAMPGPIPSRMFC